MNPTDDPNTLVNAEWPKPQYTYEELRQKLFELIDARATLQAKADRLAGALEHISKMEPGAMGLTQWACVETAKAALADYRGEE